ncbi:hypothetical protein FDP41_004258 [Naegleria fowleri]|uniref:Mitochondrial import inner membrane translocase subunit TIM50 n=1 Tax=Naegleria fowleri TaxID=5763 RepID=A0A6A5BGH2_NAEFO|nr:uncharacterized protein FDP41_004258 [Naegleria fowleri]KAF0976963.1 hypothetical protein FDP41_004258 [Naegleria fowleri]
MCPRKSLLTSNMVMPHIFILDATSCSSNAPLQRRYYGDMYNSASEKGLCKLPPLEEGDSRMTLVLDLDQTLTTVETSNRIDFKSIGVETFDILDSYTVAKRPGVDQFLLEMLKYFEIVLLTSSVQYYADSILNQLPDVFSHRLYRHHIYDSKNVSELNRDLNKVVFMDDSEYYLKDNPFNMMCVKEFMAKSVDCAKDKELEEMAVVLKRIVEKGSVFEEVGVRLLQKEWAYAGSIE